MTDKKIDAAFAAAYAELTEEELRGILEDESLDFEPSTRFQRRMRRLLRDPRGYAQRLERPLYLRAARAAAAVFLTGIVTCGVVANIPPVRAVTGGGRTQAVTDSGPFNGSTTCDVSATRVTASTSGEGTCTVEVHIVGQTLDGSSFAMTLTDSGEGSARVSCTYADALYLQVFAVHRVGNGTAFTDGSYTG